MNIEQAETPSRRRRPLKLNKAHYFNQGFQYVRTARVVAFGRATSWQHESFQRGCRAGKIYLEAEALLNGFYDPNEYQKTLLRDMVDTAASA